jgi:myo-inositol-1(or 4)-monophosphatase
VATGFPFRNKHLLPGYLEAFTDALVRFEDLRRPGAASLDLCWTAEGVFDGYFELALGPWDVAAGLPHHEPSGGVVTDWARHPDDWIRSGNVVAGAPAVHQALLGVAREDRSGGPGGGAEKIV